MRLSAALKDKLMDQRIREKLIAEGKVTKAQVDAFLKSLPDDEKTSTDTMTQENLRRASLETNVQ